MVKVYDMVACSLSAVNEDEVRARASAAETMTTRNLQSLGLQRQEHVLDQRRPAPMLEIGDIDAFIATMDR